MKFQHIAWECLHCGRRHAWKWTQYDVGSDESITMRCDKRTDKGCGGDTFGMLRKIGIGAYALTERKRA